MPIPKPKSGEKQQDFISRCMSNMNEEFPDGKQRSAVCYNSWRTTNKVLDMFTKIEKQLKGTVLEESYKDNKIKKQMIGLLEKISKELVGLKELYGKISS